jgi:hypothetical protein
MSVSTLSNQPTLDVNVKSLTTQQNIVCNGDLTVEGSTNFNVDLGEVEVDHLTISGGIGLPSGYREVIQLGTGQLNPELNKAWLIQTSNVSGEGIGFSEPEKTIRMWTGNKAGNQRTSSWENSTITVGDVVDIQVPTEVNHLTVADGKPMVAGLTEMIQLGSAPGTQAVIQTIDASASAICINGAEKSIRMWAGLTAGNQRTASWVDCSVWLQDVLQVYVPTAFNDVVRSTSNIATITPSGYIESDRLSLNRISVNPAVLDGGTSSYVSLQAGIDAGETWLYFWGHNSQTTPTPTSVGRIQCSKSYNFTGSHPINVPVSYSRKTHQGLIVSSTGKYIRPPTVTEAHFHCVLAEKTTAKSAYGVLSVYDQPSGVPVPTATDDDWENRYTNKAPQSNGTTKVAYCNQLGEGMIWCIDEQGSIQNGDLLTVSSVPGLACRQIDDVYRTTSIFRSSTDVDFRTVDSFTYPEYTVDTSGHKTLNSDKNDFIWETKTASNPAIHTVQVYNDRYDITKPTGELLVSIPFDFKTKSPGLPGRVFKASLIGGLYKF